MKKGITMISGRRFLGSLNRFAQVQFLALIAMLTLLTLPAWAAADDESGPTDLPGEQPAQASASNPLRRSTSQSRLRIVEASIQQVDPVRWLFDAAAHALAKTAFGQRH